MRNLFQSLYIFRSRNSALYNMSQLTKESFLFLFFLNLPGPVGFSCDSADEYCTWAFYIHGSAWQVLASIFCCTCRRQKNHMWLDSFYIFETGLYAICFLLAYFTFYYSLSYNIRRNLFLCFRVVCQRHVQSCADVWRWLKLIHVLNYSHKMKSSSMNDQTIWDEVRINMNFCQHLI